MIGSEETGCRKNGSGFVVLMRWKLTYWFDGAVVRMVHIWLFEKLYLAVEPRSNGPAFNGILPVTDAYFWSL